MPAAVRAHGPWVDVHAHPGRCFLAGYEADDPLAVALGGAAVADALTRSDHAGVAAVSCATVSDLRVLGVVDGGLGAIRPFSEGEAYADHRRQLAGLVDLAAEGGRTIVRSAADVLAAHEAGASALLVTCEGADFVEGDGSRLAEAHALGVRSITLVHYRPNECGDIQTADPVHGGLTPDGRAVVQEMNRLGMLIDAAHATYETTLGVLDASSDPIMISHTHLNGAGREHPRLVSLDHARAVADADGLVGAWPSGVSSVTFDDFTEEIARLVEAIGVDHVAIGTDMDANFRPVMTTYDQFSAIQDALLTRGFSPVEADRILGRNAVDLIARVCG